MTDLFTWGSRNYPERAGYRRTDTSRAAARAIEESGRAQSLQELVLSWFEQHDGTADECAIALGFTGTGVLSIRPRVAQLNKRGFLVDTERRRANGSGRMAIVWGRAR
jgi:hypothetical protein